MSDTLADTLYYPGNDTLINVGYKLLEENRYEEAITFLKLYLKAEQNITIDTLAAILSEIGYAFFMLSSYDSARAYYDSAFVLAKVSGNRQQEGYIIYNIGELYYGRGQYENSLVYSKMALEIAREIKDRSLESSSLNLTGLSYDGLSKYDLSLAYYDSALAIKLEIKDKKGENFVLINIGATYYSLGKFEKAANYFKTALQTAREINDLYLMRYAYNNLGIVYDGLSKYEEALTYYDSSLNINRSVKDRSNEAVNINNIAGIHKILGNYEKAFAYYDTALSIMREIDYKYAVGAILNNIGCTYIPLGQYDKSLAYLDSSLVIRREVGDLFGEGTTLDNIGKVFYYQGKLENALAYFDSALNIEKKIGDQRGLAISLHNAGRTYMELGQYEKTLTFLDSALMIIKEIKDRLHIGNIYNDIARVYSLMKIYDRAIAYFDSALSLRREIKDQTGEGISLYYLGKLYQNTGNLESAITYYKQSIDIKEKIRKNILSEELMSYYVEKEREVYENLISLLVQLGRYEEAFEYIERCHSKVLRDVFEESGISAYDPSLQRALERINYLEAEIAGLKKRFAKGEISDTEFEEKLDNLNGKLNQRIFDLKAYHPEIFEMMEPRRKAIIYNREALPENTVFLEYAPVEDKYIVFVFSKNIFLVKTIEDSREKINNTAMECVNCLKLKISMEDLNVYLENLFNILVKPCEKEIEPYNNVVIIPYGPLHYLPFHCFKRKNINGRLEYFFEYKRISYLPMASFIVDIKPQNNLANKKILAFGNPDGTLPAAEIEVDSVSALFPKSVTFKSSNARKDKLLELSQKYNYLHLATHGRLTADPRFSYIVLAPKDTGNLTVREILGLAGYFKTMSLVTLSACETAIEKDPMKAGMELTTLSNAFKSAGVSCIIASLWPVTDVSTTMLMTLFYRYIKKGNRDKLEALRQAQKDIMENSLYSHPFYWAPFILIGDWR